MENRVYKFDDWAKEFQFKDREWVPMRIEYTVDIGHPDINCIMKHVKEHDIEDGILIHEDKYRYSEEMDIENFIFMAIQDLKLIAGGGWYCKNIHKVKIFVQDKQVEI